MNPAEKAQEQEPKIRVSRKTVLVFGDRATGKRTLIKKLQGGENPILGQGLKYAYLDIKDESEKDITRLNVWILDSIPGNENLLHMIINTTSYTQISIVLTVSMAQPWVWMDQLTDCSDMLLRHVENLRMDTKEKQEARQRLLQKWKNYCKENDINTPENCKQKISSTDETDSLTEEALKINIGLDIAVVVTQTDRMAELRKDYGFQEEHFTFLEQWIRRFCLQHGASLLYTNIKNEKNCAFLHELLIHRITGARFCLPVQVVERDALLIPAGWDSLEKMGILPENKEPCQIEEFYSTLPGEKINGEEEEILAKRKVEEEPEPPPKTSSECKRKKEVTQISPVLLAYYFDIMHKKTGASPARREAMRISRGLDGLLDPETVDSITLGPIINYFANILALICVHIYKHAICYIFPVLWVENYYISIHRVSLC
ncbi:cytoplasmic dynein 1 light intermediate chain 2-like isoform X1 [Glossina fuscipes]|uniref:Dynein light intermediate chain n=1 Tax=Glossina fuscipes TaxID=7396 RepID=A0A9C5Z4D5_9MUSC|nr:cytoplasmic dynein 1 light intermediate chain 2-like isoform X1 [Glossina fuscipes]